MHKTSFRPLVLACVATLALAACGGDDYAEEVADDAGQVPASATGSAAVFSTYVAGLPANDGTEPLTLVGLAPPVSDTDEPIALR